MVVNNLTRDLGSGIWIWVLCLPCRNLPYGWGCLLFKIDLKRAYRQIFIDPGDMSCLGYCVDNELYFDTTLAMGLRSAAAICQKCTDVLMYIYRTDRRHEGVNYLDDMASADRGVKAWRAFYALRGLLMELRIKESLTKAARSATVMTFLGVQADTVEMTLGLTLERLAKITAKLRVRLAKSKATKRELQQLVGKLNFAADTVKSGRLFFSRILNFMNGLPERGNFELPETVRKDVRWWHKFMPGFDGIALILEPKWSRLGALFTTDACLTGARGWSSGDYFHVEFPKWMVDREDININELECMTTVLALKAWGYKFARKQIVIRSDNETTVSIINSGRARNEFAQGCLREICFLAAKNNCVVRAIFLRGRLNSWADMLSRQHLNPLLKQRFLEETRHLNVKQTKIPDSWFRFSHDW